MSLTLRVGGGGMLDPDGTKDPGNERFASSRYFQCQRFFFQLLLSSELQFFKDDSKSENFGEFVGKSVYQHTHTIIYALGNPLTKIEHFPDVSTNLCALMREAQASPELHIWHS